jgi:hypothetical protein
VLSTADWSAGVAAVRLTRQQVKDGPPIESDQPVSRQMEMDLYSYFDVPYYWGPTGASLAGSGYTPMPLGTSVPSPAGRETDSGKDATHLRSANEVKGYYIKAKDDDVGHVEDLIIDDEEWAIRYLVVDTKNWLPGRKVLVARDWVDDVSWPGATVAVGLTKDKVKSSPEYSAGMSLDRSYEQRLYRHYDRGGYWMM